MASNTYPAQQRVNKAGTLDVNAGWTCVDTAGNVADPPAGLPAAILVDRRSPDCRIALSRSSVPRSGTPTSVTASVVGSDGESGVALARIVAISPAPAAGPALPVDGAGTWTLVGRSGAVFTFTAEVTDIAGNVRSCSDRTVSR